MQFIFFQHHTSIIEKLVTKQQKQWKCISRYHICILGKQTPIKSKRKIRSIYKKNFKIKKFIKIHKLYNGVEIFRILGNPGVAGATYTYVEVLTWPSSRGTGIPVATVIL